MYYTLILPGSGLVSKLITSCVYGHSYDKIVADSAGAPKGVQGERSMGSSFVQLLFCFVGLQVSYLTWGVLQEKIMTKVDVNEMIRQLQVLKHDR